MMTTELHYFAVHQLSDDRHIGFLVLDNNQEHAEYGQCAFKLVAPVGSLSVGENIFEWRIVKQKQMDLFLLDENGHTQDQAIGFIRQEYMNIQGNILVLNDLMGSM